MNNIELRKLQLVELEILKEIDRVCSKYNIKYWLTGGTLIGAIRHNGFIPWDDDIDIAMFRNDYEKFIKIAPYELSDQFYMQNWETELNFVYPYTKIRKNNTILLETGSERASIHHGVFVDIFAYDKFPLHKLDLMKIKFTMQILFRMMLAKGGFTPWRGINHINYYKKLLYALLNIVSKFISIQSMKNIYRKYVQIANKTNSDYVFNSCEINDEKHPIPEEYVKKVVLHRFEDAQFYIPAEYDKLLRHFYGDYMQLPPPEKREGHHNIVELKLE